MIALRFLLLSLALPACAAQLATPPDHSADASGARPLLYPPARLQPTTVVQPAEPDCTAPLLIGHRGTRAAAPENTLQAFSWALDNGADGIEIDVRMTVDGALVAFHDSTVARTTDHPHDPALRGMTLEELQRLDAGAWFDAAFSGATVPTIEALLQAVAAREALLVFDIKRGDVGPVLVELLRRYEVSGRAIFASNQLSVLQGLFELAPEVPALYFMSDIDEIDSVSLPSLHYLRVPKAVEHEAAHVQRIVDAGFEVAISARQLSWAGPDGVLTALLMADDVASSYERRARRRPAQCAP